MTPSPLTPGSPQSTESTDEEQSVPPVTLSDLLAEVRSQLERLEPMELHRLLSSPLGARDVVVLDTRTPTDRTLYGCIEGALHAPRTVLEWRVAPDAPLRLPQITGTDQLLVVVCNEGFSSSMAAASLQRLGFTRATDLIGGIQAWRDAGLPLVAPANDEIGVRQDCV